MGTRHLVKVIVDGRTRIAQYGQWDGYLDGQGATVRAFLKSVDIDKFTEAVRTVTKFIEDETLDQWRQEFFADDGDRAKDGWLTMEQAERWKEEYPTLSRDMGAEVLAYVMTAWEEDPRCVVPLQDASEFEADTLFCEFAYTLDLDQHTVTVVGGYEERKTSTHPIFEWVNNEDILNTVKEEIGDS